MPPSGKDISLVNKGEVVSPLIPQPLFNYIILFYANYRTQLFYAKDRSHRTKNKKNHKANHRFFFFFITIAFPVPPKSSKGMTALTLARATRSLSYYNSYIRRL